MLRRITAGAGSLGFLAAATAARAQTTGREIFTPVQNDLALVNLRKLLGCVVDGVWTAASCTDDRPLTVALGYFNVGCLIVATILACYLLYSLVADTANDGEAFGRQSSAKYTLLRVITGAILSLPIKSGLSLVQILVVQLAVWGSGFGDTLWTRVAGTGLNGMYGTLTSPTQALGDFVLRGKLAKVLEGRLYGYVCARPCRPTPTTSPVAATLPRSAPRRRRKPIPGAHGPMRGQRPIISRTTTGISENRTISAAPSSMSTTRSARN